MPEPISASAGLRIASRGWTAASGLWGQRKLHLANMRSVVAEVDSEWDGFTEDDGDLAGMLVRVRVSNHGAELVRLVIVKMHRRESAGTSSSKFVPALPAQQSELFTVPRILGLMDDRPFPEE